MNEFVFACRRGQLKSAQRAYERATAELETATAGRQQAEAERDTLAARLTSSSAALATADADRASAVKRVEAAEAALKLAEADHTAAAASAAAALRQAEAERDDARQQLAVATSTHDAEVRAVSRGPSVVPATDVPRCPWTHGGELRRRISALQRWRPRSALPSKRFVALPPLFSACAPNLLC